MAKASIAARKNRKTIRKRTKKITNAYKQNKKKNAGKPPGLAPNLILSPVRMGAAGPYRRWISPDEKKTIDAEQKDKTMDEIIKEQKQKAESDAINTIGGIKSKMLNVDKRFDKMKEQTDALIKKIDETAPPKHEAQHSIEQEIKLRDAEKKAKAPLELQKQIEITSELNARSFEMEFDADVLEFLENINNVTKQQQKQQREKEKTKEKAETERIEALKKAKEVAEKARKEKEDNIDTAIKKQQEMDRKLLGNADYSNLKSEVMNNKITLEEAVKTMQAISDVTRDLKENTVKDIGKTDELYYASENAATGGEFRAKIVDGKLIKTKMTVSSGTIATITKDYSNKHRKAEKLAIKAYENGDLKDAREYKTATNNLSRDLEKIKKGEASDIHSVFLFANTKPEQARATTTHEIGHKFQMEHDKELQEKFGVGFDGEFAAIEVEEYRESGGDPPSAETLRKGAEHRKREEEFKKKGITRRGKQTWQETVAENYTFYERGHLDKMDPDMLEFMQTHTKFHEKKEWQDRVKDVTGQDHNII